MLLKRFIFIFTAAATSALPQSSDPLAGLVRNALERNRELQAARRRIEEAQGLLRQAGVRLAPTVEFEGATGRPLGTHGEEEYSAGFFYPVQTAGKRQKRVQVARAGLDLARAEFDDSSRRLVYQVKTRYVDAVADTLRAGALARILESTRETLRLTQARVEHGDAAPLERNLLAVDVNRVGALQASAAGRASAASAELAALAGLSGDHIPPIRDFPAPATVGSSEELRLRALASRPDLRIARLLESQGAAETQLAEAESRPDLSLSARYARRSAQFDQFGLDSAGHTVPLRDRDNIVSFGLSVPLLTRSRNLGNIQAAGARAAAARLHREHLERVIPLEVEAAWRRWDSARRAAALLDASLLAESARNLEIVRQAYSLGQLRMLDVLNEQRRAIDTEMAQIDVVADLARAAAELERAVGGDIQ